MLPRYRTSRACSCHLFDWSHLSCKIWNRLLICIFSFNDGFNSKDFLEFPGLLTVAADLCIFVVNSQFYRVLSSFLYNFSFHHSTFRIAQNLLFLVHHPFSFCCTLFQCAVLSLRETFSQTYPLYIIFIILREYLGISPLLLLQCSGDILLHRNFVFCSKRTFIMSSYNLQYLLWSSLEKWSA